MRRRLWWTCLLVGWLAMIPAYFVVVPHETVTPSKGAPSAATTGIPTFPVGASEFRGTPVELSTALILKAPPPPPPPPPPPRPTPTYTPRPVTPRPKPHTVPVVGHWSVNWDAIAICESSGNWSINSGNSFYGGLQFTRSTWLAYGGGAFASTANLATKAEQIVVAERTLRGQGIHAWPVCGARGSAQGSDYARLVVHWVNFYRVNYGRTPLKFGVMANTWSDAWVKKSALNFRHSNLQRFLDWTGAEVVGEVMVNGDVTPRQVALLWLQSPEHREIILSRTFTHQGVGAVLYRGRWYVVMDVLYR